MSKETSALEAALEKAGVNVVAAKSDLEKLDAVFGGEAGDIPEKALGNWADAHFNGDALRSLAVTLGREWEKEIVQKLPKERQVERQPGAHKDPQTGKIVVPSKAGA